MQTAAAFPVPGAFEQKARPRGLEGGGVKFFRNCSQSFRVTRGWLPKHPAPSGNQAPLSSLYVDHLRVCPCAHTGRWGTGVAGR